MIGGTPIPPGTRQTIDLPVARLYTHTEMSMPVHVIRGKREGPRLFVSAALHGDELNGVEVIRRLLALKRLDRLRGMLLLVPVVNVYGFVGRTRYLPDRRDLNRFFPGSPTGSLAARLAHLFMQEVVARSTHGIDLHTGAVHRTNLPHIRAAMTNEDTAHLAKAFGTPVIIDASLRDGSLRQAVRERGVPILLFEGGEALRIDEPVVRAGLRGVPERDGDARHAADEKRPSARAATLPAGGGHFECLGPRARRAGSSRLDVRLGRRWRSATSWV